MSTSAKKTTTQQFEETLAQSKPQSYILRLYITGITYRSSQAIENIRRICETYLQGSYQLEIIDIYQNPELAQKEQIIAAPTLIKQLPLPLRKLVGDLSNEERVLAGLNLQPKKNEFEL